MPAYNRNIHYLYKITRFDGKFYIGIHSTDNLKDNYFGSGILLKRSINKYGQNNHKLEIIEFFSNRKLAVEKEKEIVNEVLLTNSLCLNMVPGGTGGNIGGGGFYSKDHKSKFHSGGGLSTSKKRKEDKIFKENIDSKISIGMKNWVNKNREKVLSSQKAATAVARLPVAIAKRKATYLITGHSKGEKNPNFGKIWINNGINKLGVKKEVLQEYLNNGYCLGRKIKK
jgi:hypothetical protein